MKKSVLGLASFISILAGATAASALVVPQQMQDILKYIFIDLAKLGLTGDTSAIIAFKFILWILAFAIFYFGINKSKVFGGETEKKNVAIIVAIVLALMTTIMIPSSLVMTLFQTYAAIGGIIMVALPCVGGIYLSKKLFSEDSRFNYFMRGVILFLVAYFLLTLLASMVATGQGVYLKMYEWGVLGAVGCVIAGFVNFGYAVGSKGIDTAFWGAEKAQQREQNAITQGTQNNIKLVDIGNAAAAAATFTLKKLFQGGKLLLSNLWSGLQATKNALANMKLKKELTADEQNQIKAISAQLNATAQHFIELEQKSKVLMTAIAQQLTGYNSLKDSAAREHKKSQDIVKDIPTIEGKLKYPTVKSAVKRQQFIDRLEQFRNDNKKKFIDITQLETDVKNAGDSLTIMFNRNKTLGAEIKKLKASVPKLKVFQTIAKLGADVNLGVKTSTPTLGKIFAPAAKTIDSMIKAIDDTLNISANINTAYEHSMQEFAAVDAVIPQFQTGFNNVKGDFVQLQNDIAKSAVDLKKIQTDVDLLIKEETDMLTRADWLLRQHLGNVQKLTYDQYGLFAPLSHFEYIESKHTQLKTYVKLITGKAEASREALEEYANVYDKLEGVKLDTVVDTAKIHAKLDTILSGEITISNKMNKLATLGEAPEAAALKKEIFDLAELVKDAAAAITLPKTA